MKQEQHYSELVLITGPPRSGTTWLNREICKGTSVFPFLPECTFLTKQVEIYSNIINYSDEKRFTAYFGNKENLVAFFSETIYRQINIAASINKLSDAKILVLKDPAFSLYLDEISLLFPPHRLVVIVRDPLDVIASMKNVNKKKKTCFNINNVAEEIFIYYFKISRFLDKNNVNNSFFVRYEDLVATGEMNALKSFLPEGMIECASKKNDMSSFQNMLDVSDPFFSELYLRPTTQEKIGSYLDILSEDEINLIQTIFSGVIQQWKY